MSKPNILFVINSMAGGGAERVMSTLLAHSERYGERFDISLALLDDEPGAYPLPSWLTVHQLDCAHNALASFVRLRRLVGKIRPDATVSFLTRANIASAVAAIGRAHPFVISERTNTSVHLGEGPRALASGLMVRLAYRRAARVIVVSRGVGETLKDRYQVPRELIEVVPNPVDVDSIQANARRPDPLAALKPTVVAVGRLMPLKNFAMLIRAFARSGLGGILVIAGEGPERPKLERLAAELGIAERVMLPGFLDNPYPLLAAAQVFALSSDCEGFPNALVEALALAVPVVATNCLAGPAEILAGKDASEIDGLTVAPAGVITPVGDEKAFAQALCLAASGDIRAQIVAGGSAAVARYSVQSAVERYWQLIEGALAKRA